MICEYCGRDNELRPYGRNGAQICFDCAIKPENKKTAESQFENQLDACGPLAIIGEDCGPVPPKADFKQ